MAKSLTTLTLHQQLKTTDLGEVLHLFKKHHYSGVNFHDLGLYLGLSIDTLRVIEADHKGDTRRCLSECIAKWFEEVDDVQKNGGPTINSLVSALRKLGENGVANGIENEIQSKLGPASSILDRYMSDKSLERLLPQLVVFLYDEGIIKKVKLPPNDPLPTIKDAILEGVASAHHNLVKLIKILKENGAGNIATEIEKEYYTKFSKEKEAASDIATGIEPPVDTTSTGFFAEAEGQRQPISPPKDFSPLIFEDEVYGVIVIDHPLIVEIIKTCQFQRLKDIKQLGYTYQNIPKANYSRLQHSIGMYHLAGEYVKQLQSQRGPELNITDSDVLCVQIAALCYNLGHGPFSHTFEMFLDEISKEEQTARPWSNVSEASIKMFDYMLEDNEGLRAFFRKYFGSSEESITFIKELMRDKRTMPCIEDKDFLYEIILNESQMNVKVIDYTTRDAAVLGAKLSFKWRVFLTKVRVLRCEDDGKFHICFHEDDLETYNDFFNTHSSLYRELYYLRKIRIVAFMIKIILKKANKAGLIPLDLDTNEKVTISNATKKMATYTDLTDSVLTLIKLSVDDPLAQGLLKCLDTIKFIAQIGYIVPPESFNKSPNDLKGAIVKEAGSDEIECDLIVDPVHNGYKGQDGWSQHFYRDDDNSTGKWTGKWAEKKYTGSPPWRVFLVSGNRRLIKTAQDALKRVIENENIQIGRIYPDRENFDLMPDFPIRRTSGAGLNVPKEL